MRVFVTGATGFVGGYVVASLLHAGHDVVAVCRSVSGARRLPWAGSPRVTLVSLDLRSRRGLAEALRGCDAVVHLAAAKSGDIYTQLAGTVVATENLLDAMAEAGVTRLLHCSSFSVYRWTKRMPGGLIDEAAPLEDKPRLRDDYAVSKLRQEALVRRVSQTRGLRTTIVRPGFIYGKDNMFLACLGGDFTPTLWLRIGARARVPLTYVENCAEAMAACLASEDTVGHTINIVDDELPTVRRYASLLRARLSPRPRIIPMPWVVYRRFVSLVALWDRVVCGGRMKLPSLASARKLDARCKPMRYNNALLVRLTGYRSRVTLAESFERSFGVDPLGDFLRRGGGATGPRGAVADGAHPAVVGDAA